MALSNCAMLEILMVKPNVATDSKSLILGFSNEVSFVSEFQLNRVKTLKTFFRELGVRYNMSESVCLSYELVTYLAKISRISICRRIEKGFTNIYVGSTIFKGSKFIETYLEIIFRTVKKPGIVTLITLCKVTEKEWTPRIEI